MTVTPKAPYDSGSLLTALCVWREARSEIHLAKVGVVWVLMNRARMSPAQGFARTIAAEILRPWQFSSFNEGDPNCDLYPDENDPSWQDSLDAAEAPGLVDPTNGAVFYFSRPLTEPPTAWGDTIVTARIGHLTFCGLAERVT